MKRRISRGRALGAWAAAAVCIACVVPLGTPGSPPDGGGPPKGEAGSPADGGSRTSDGQVASADAAGPTGSWTNVTSNLANMASECGNLTSLFTKPDEDLIVAGIALNGLWASRDGGNTWQALGSGPGSAVITNRPTSLVFDPQVPSRYWESGIYNQGGVYATNDDGNTFVLLGNTHHDDLVSVDFSDPARATLLAGGHEQSQLLNRSTDGGKTWSNVGVGLPASDNCDFPLVVDAQTYLVGCVAASGGGPGGVYRTLDGAQTWSNVAASGGASAPLSASDGSIYWASPGGKGLARSADHGAHWVDVTGPGSITSVHPIELPDGRLATLGGQNVIVASANHGAAWTPASVTLPYSDATGLVYSRQQKAFYVWHSTCGFNGAVPVPADGVMRFAFDYTKR